MSVFVCSQITANQQWNFSCYSQYFFSTSQAMQSGPSLLNLLATNIILNFRWITAICRTGVYILQETRDLSKNSNCRYLFICLREWISDTLLIKSIITVLFSSFGWLRWRHSTACRLPSWILLSSGTDSRTGVSLSSWYSPETFQSIHSWCLCAMSCRCSIEEWQMKDWGFALCHYKDIGLIALCSTGMFCSEPGLSQPTGLCDPGYYCPAGSSSSNSESQVITLFHYLPCLKQN